MQSSSSEKSSPANDALANCAKRSIRSIGNCSLGLRNTLQRSHCGNENKQDGSHASRACRVLVNEQENTPGYSTNWISTPNTNPALLKTISRRPVVHAGSSALIWYISVAIYLACLTCQTLLRIRGLHQDLVGAANLEQRFAREGLPALAMITSDATSRAESLLAVIEQVIDFFNDSTEKLWLTRLFDLWRRDGLDSDITRLFNELIPIMSTIADRRPEMLRNAVRIPQQTVDHPEDR